MAEIRFKGIPDREDWVVCQIYAGGVILVESAAGPIEEVLLDVICSLERMSERIHQAASQDDES